MSTNLYIHPENQKLLWRSIQNVPFIANLPPDFKQEWFKNIIKQFYEQNPNIRDKESLQHINKQTIQYMVNSASAKKITETQPYGYVQSVQKEIRPTPTTPAATTAAVGIQSEFTRFDSDSKKNNEWYNKAFAERQKEYEIMHAKPLAPDIDFSIKLDDSPISNVNELVEKYKKEREQDLNAYSNHPLAVSPVLQPASSMPSPTLSLPLPPHRKTPVVHRLQVIKEEDANLDIDETISAPVATNSEIEDLKKQINDLKLEMEQMKKTLNSIITNPSS